MKKYLPFAHYIAAGLGGIALALRLWMLSGGTDDRGLYPDHFTWPLVCIISLGAVVFFWLLSRQADPVRPYRENFPASILGAAGHLAAALALAITGLGLFGSALLSAILALLAAAALALGGYLRYLGKRPPCLVHAVPTAFFALQLFTLGKDVGAEPETHLFLFPFLATVALMLASYQLWGIDVKEGNRQKSLFWSLTAGYLCLVAIPSSGLLYLGCGLWMLTNLCSLMPERQRREAPVEPAPEVAAEPVPEETEQLPTDPDLLIEQLLKDLESK